jgi:hypothetical protein
MLEVVLAIVAGAVDVVFDVFGLVCSALLRYRILVYF